MRVSAAVLSLIASFKGERFVFGFSGDSRGPDVPIIDPICSSSFGPAILPTLAAALVASPLPFSFTVGTTDMSGKYK